MNRYSLERKESVLKKLLPPHNLSVAELARQEGISDVTLYTWRKQAKARGEVVPGSAKVPEDWPAEAKLAAVGSTGRRNTCLQSIRRRVKAQGFAGALIQA